MSEGRVSGPTVYAAYASLVDRVVVVSGGASGIGAAIVREFAAQSARVAFLDVQEVVAAELVESPQDVPHLPRFYRCDLTDTAELRETVARIEDEFGRIDVLVNNAGNDTRHKVEEVTPELWESLMAVNLKQQFFLCQSVLPGMRQRGWGSIINMSSIAWMIPSVGVPVYATAKAGIVGMTRTLAHEVGTDNVRVNAVLPGAILTERQKRLWLTEAYTAEILSRQAIKRMILPEEVARLILFLGADDSAAITNQSFVIDGGWV